MLETLSVLGMNLLVGLIKRYVKPKFGDTGVHVLLFVIAFLILSIKGFMTQYPPLQNMLVQAGTFTVGAIALYEVLWKQIVSQLNV